jgi:hypothetical protein
MWPQHGCADRRAANKINPGAGVVVWARKVEVSQAAGDLHASLAPITTLLLAQHQDFQFHLLFEKRPMLTITISVSVSITLTSGQLTASKVSQRYGARFQGLCCNNKL